MKNNSMKVIIRQCTRFNDKEVDSDADELPQRERKQAYLRGVAMRQEVVKCIHLHSLAIFSTSDDPSTYKKILSLKFAGKSWIKK